MRTLRWLILAWLTMVGPTAIGAESEKLAVLRENIRELKMQVSAWEKEAMRAPCTKLLNDILESNKIKPIAPAVEGSAFEAPQLSAYKARCPDLNLCLYEAPPHTVPYYGSRDFRVFNLANSYTGFTRDKYFLFYAEAYFSPSEVNRMHQYGKVHPWTGYAYPNAAGGGALYSVVDTEQCQFSTQLVVHGHYDLVANKTTKHLNQLFEYDNQLHAYDFYIFEGNEKKLAGLRIWAFNGPDSVQQKCTYEPTEKNQR